MTFCGYHGSTSSDPLVETVVPSSDDVTGSWSSSTANPIYQELGVQTTAAYAQVPTVSGTQTCPTTSDDVLSVNMTDPSSTPAYGGVQGMRFRYQVRFQFTGLTPSTFSVAWQVDLKEGATTIASGTDGPFTNPASDGVWEAESTVTLTEGEVDSISDHSQLKMEVTATMCDDGTDGVEANIAYTVLDYYAR